MTNLLLIIICIYHDSENIFMLVNVNNSENLVSLHPVLTAIDLLPLS